MRIDLEEIERMILRRKKINSVPLIDITWYRNGKRLDVPMKLIRNWPFVGMNNIDFAYYKLLDEMEAPRQEGG